MLLSSALSLQPRSGAGATGKSHEDTIGAIATDIEERLPAQFDIEKALIDFPVRYEESMNTVLTQELLRFNRLTATMKRSLDDLRRAIKGSCSCQPISRPWVVVALGRVPLVWSAWPTSLRRAARGSRTCSSASPSSRRGRAPALPRTRTGFRASSSRRPSSRARSRTTRKHQLPIDTVAFDHAVLPPEEQREAEANKVADGVGVWGLFIEGARWEVDSHVLAESRARELFTTMPYLHLLPKLKTDIEAVKGRADLCTGEENGTKHVLMCPVYKTSVRQGVLSTTGHSTNFVMFVLLPMAPENTQKHWIKRGVACLCGLDD